jgi:hypothetical protein
LILLSLDLRHGDLLLNVLAAELETACEARLLLLHGEEFDVPVTGSPGQGHLTEDVAHTCISGTGPQEPTLTHVLPVEPGGLADVRACLIDNGRLEERPLLRRQASQDLLLELCPQDVVDVDTLEILLSRLQLIDAGGRATGGRCGTRSLRLLLLRLLAHLGPRELNRWPTCLLRRQLRRLALL